MNLPSDKLRSGVWPAIAAIRSSASALHLSKGVGYQGFKECLAWCKKEGIRPGNVTVDFEESP